MVIPAGIDKLLVILADAFPNQMRLPEIEGRTIYGGYFSGRYALGIDGGIMGSIDLHQILFDAAIAFAAKAEEGMMAEADRRRFVGGSQISNLELVIRVEGISHRHIQIAGIAFKAVGVKEMEDDGCVAGGDHIPYEMVDALEAAVEGIAAVVIYRGMILHAVKGKGCSADTVCNRAYAGAQEPLPWRGYIFLNGLVTDNDIFEIAVFVGGSERHHAGAIIGYDHSDITGHQTILFILIIFTGKQGKSRYDNNKNFSHHF